MRLPLPFRIPFPDTSFHWLLASDALTLLSMMVGAVALPWWIAQSGGAHDLAVYGVLASAMGFVALPLLSPFADRHSKRSLIAVGLLVFGVAASAMAAFASLWHYRLGVVIAIESITVLANALIMPATNSIVTELVPPAALSLGLLFGSLGPAAWWSRVQGRFGTRVSGSALIGAALALAGWTSDRHVLVACFAVVGACAAATTLVGKTHRMLARPLAFRARMSSAAIMTTQVSQTLGPAIAGVALAHASVRAVYLGFGLGAIVSALGFFLIPGFRAFMALEHDEVDNWYGKTYPKAFER